MANIGRKYLAHFINTTPGSNAVYERLGKDLEEFNVELNPEVEEKKNIMGENNVKVSGYTPSASAEPYYADEGTGLHTLLQDIVDNRKVLDDLKTDVVEVHLWEETSANSGIFKAFRDEVIIEVSSYGGDTTGYQIPFSLHYTNVRTQGTFNVATKTFIPSSGTLGTLTIEVIAGSDATHTKVSDIIGEGSGTLKYKIAAALSRPNYGDSDSGYTTLSLNTDLACAANNKIIVVESASGQIVATSIIKKVVVGS